MTQKLIFWKLVSDFKKNNLGIFANSFDKDINKYNFRKNLKIAIMINASDFDLSKNYKKQLSKYILRRENSKISIIRIATHLKDLSKIIPHIKFLKKLGYFIILNLMQIDKVSSKDLIKSLNLLKKIKVFKYILFCRFFWKFKAKRCKKISNNN